MQFKNIKCERDHQKGVSCSFLTPCCFYSRRHERHHCRIFKRSQTTLGCSPAELLLHWCGCENTPHCLTAWSHLAERLFMGAIPASESFFSSVLSWSVCVDAKNPPTLTWFFYLLADHERWHCSHPNPACLFQSGLIAVTLVTVFDMQLLLPHSHLTFSTCCFNAAVICVDVSLKLVSDKELQNWCWKKKLV